MLNILAWCTQKTLVQMPHLLDLESAPLFYENTQLTQKSQVWIQWVGLSLSVLLKLFYFA